jgi:hypothetical protein
MAGRYQGYHFIRDEDGKGDLGFEVYWDHEGWFWRPLLTLGGEPAGPFTKSTEAYQSALAQRVPRKTLDNRSATYSAVHQAGAK